MYVTLKKKYGQNFLIDQNILLKISNLIGLKKLNIIEIGPGDGRLTEKIINCNPKKLTLIEVDKDLVPNLKNKFSNFQNINILNKNVLDLDVNIECDIIISNLPYNISSQILVKICSQNHLPKKCILMFQKEFANRLMENKLNSLNSLVKCFFEINKEFYVSKNCFRPIPKVDSAVLKFSKKKTLLLEKNEINKFIDFKRKIFSYKRKTLKSIFRKYKFKFDEIDLNQRVEEIDLCDFIKIFRKFKNETY